MLSGRFNRGHISEEEALVEKEMEGGNHVVRRSCDLCRLDATLPPALLPIAKNKVERRHAQISFNLRR